MLFVFWRAQSLHFSWLHILFPDVFRYALYSFIILFMSVFAFYCFVLVALSTRLICKSHYNKCHLPLITHYSHKLLSRLSLIKERIQRKIIYLQLVATQNGNMEFFAPLPPKKPPTKNNLHHYDELEEMRLMQSWSLQLAGKSGFGN